MPLVTIPGSGFVFPHRWRETMQLQTGSTAFRSLQMNASGEKVAYIVKIPKTGTIDSVGILVRAVGQAATLKVGLETVDLTTGEPTGSAYGGMVAGTQTSPTAETYFEVALGTSATATAKEYVAVVIEFDSFVAGDDVSIGAWDTHISSNEVAMFPHVAHFTGSWAKERSIPMTHFLYSDASIPFIGTVAGVVGANQGSAYHSGSSPDEIGMRFKLPFDFQLSGISAHFRPRIDVNIKLYDKDDNPLDTISYDQDVVAGSELGYSNHIITPQPLNKNEIYRITELPTEAVDGQFTPFWTFESAKYMDLWGSQEFFKTERTNAGAWTDTVLDRPMMHLRIDQFDSGGFKPREFRHGV